MAHRWAAGWAGATPGFWTLVRPKPSRLRLGSLPPTLRQNQLRVDLVDDIRDDADIGSNIITERDIRVDHDDFNLVDDSRRSRIADVMPCQREGQPMPVIEPEDKPRKKAFFTARVDPSVVDMLRAYCEFLNTLEAR